jgi:hypothetical protein
MSDELSAPATTKGRLQRALLALMRQHEEDGTLPTNGRFLFYELTQAGVVPKAYYHSDGSKKARQPSADITDALTVLRELGRVPWSAIIDETRTVDDWEFADSVFEYVAQQTPYARIDLWAGRPAPMLISESGAAHGVLRRLAGTYLVPITATRGQSRGHIINRIVPLLIGNDRRVGYIGDHELRGPGEQIEEHTRRVIEEHAGRMVRWERIALTQAQVDADPRLEALVIEKLDRRYKPPKPYSAVECEAVGQRVLVELVRDWLDAQLPEPLDDVLAREDEQRRQVAEILRRAR